MRYIYSFWILIGLLGVSSCSSDDVSLEQRNKNLIIGKWVLFASTVVHESGDIEVNQLKLSSNCEGYIVTFYRDSNSVYETHFCNGYDDQKTFGYEIAGNFLNFPSQKDYTSGSYWYNSPRRNNVIKTLDKSLLVLELYQPNNNSSLVKKQLSYYKLE